MISGPQNLMLFVQRKSVVRLKKIDKIKGWVTIIIIIIIIINCVVMFNCVVLCIVCV